MPESLATGALIEFDYVSPDPDVPWQVQDLGEGIVARYRRTLARKSRVITGTGGYREGSRLPHGDPLRRLLLHPLGVGVVVGEQQQRCARRAGVRGSLAESEQVSGGQVGHAAGVYPPDRPVKCLDVVVAPGSGRDRYLGLVVELHTHVAGPVVPPRCAGDVASRPASARSDQRDVRDKRRNVRCVCART